MKEKPILFSTAMVRAILDGRKTMTRRVCKIQPIPIITGYDLTATLTAGCPYGKVDDRLWVRETWMPGDSAVKYYYRATKPEQGNYFKWHPSIFMPREASRITLEITNIKIERLQDISAMDIEREGTLTENTEISKVLDIWIELWDSINAKRGYGWETNPWVWCISFKKI